MKKASVKKHCRDGSFIVARQESADAESICLYEIIEICQREKENHDVD